MPTQNQNPSISDIMAIVREYGERGEVEDLLESVLERIRGRDLVFLFEVLESVTDVEEANVIVGIVVIYDVEHEFRFDRGHMYDMFGCHLTNTQLQEIADVLAANVEEPEPDEDGCVEICRRNFNDCFGDMMEDLEESY